MWSDHKDIRSNKNDFSPLKIPLLLSIQIIEFSPQSKITPEQNCPDSQFFHSRTCLPHSPLPSSCDPPDSDRRPIASQSDTTQLIYRRFNLPLTPHTEFFGIVHCFICSRSFGTSHHSPNPLAKLDLFFVCVLPLRNRKGYGKVITVKT